MSILQVHLELADRFPNIHTFEGEEVDFQVNVENSENPIQFEAKRQCYYFNEDTYKTTELEPHEIVNNYRHETLEYGAQKVRSDGLCKTTFAQDEIYNNPEDIECYDKIFLILAEDEILPLANLNFTYWASKHFRYHKSYIAFYESFAVTLWSGHKRTVHVPKEDNLSFICNTSNIHYRLKFKSTPFDR